MRIRKQQLAQTVSASCLQDLRDIWGIQDVTVDDLSTQWLETKLKSLSLDQNISWRTKAHLRAASYWFRNFSIDVESIVLVQNCLEVCHHMVEIQDWQMCRNILWIPINSYPLHRLLSYSKFCKEFLLFLNTIKHYSDTYWQCFLLYKIGNIQSTLGEIEAAYQSFEQQVELAKTLQLPRALIKGYGGLGRLYSYYQTNSLVAQSFFQKQLRLARQHRDHLEIVYALDGLARAHHIKFDSRRAVYYSRQAWITSQTIQDPELQKLQLLRLQSSYLHVDLKKTNQYSLQQQFDIAQTSQNKQHIWESAYIFGLAASHSGQWEDALNKLKLASDVAQEIQDVNGQCRSIAAMGSCYTRMREWTQAISFINEALIYAQQVGNQEAEAISFFNLSYCYSETEHLIRALRYAVCLKKISIEMNSKYFQGLFYIAVSNVHWHKQRRLSAIWLAFLGICLILRDYSTNTRFIITEVMARLKLAKSQMNS